VTPVTRVVPTGRESDAPAATSTRGLIIVVSAPVSSRRLAFVLPLIFTSTMIALPGVYLMVVPPFGTLATGAAAPGRPGVLAGGVTAGAPRGGNLIGTARARNSCGTLSMPST
jgi:hypothetical protein